MLHEVNATDVTNELVENGARRQWTAKSHAALIRMFASHGFDVVRGFVVGGIGGTFTTDPNAGGVEEKHARHVVQDGRIVASILWHPEVPGFAFANTARTFNEVAI